MSHVPSSLRSVPASLTRASLVLAGSACMLLASGAYTGRQTPRQATGLSERLREVVEWDYEDSNTTSAKHLLRRGADPNGYGSDGMTFLGEAIRDKNHALAHFLIVYGAQVNARSRDGEPPLVTALRRQDTPLVRALLAAGARVNVRDQRGGTPLMWAVLSPTPHLGEATVKALLGRGAQVNLRDRRGETALVIAARGHDEPGILSLLRSAGARQ